MSESTLNGLPVLAGTITLPRVGAWRADFDVDGEDVSKVSGAIEIVVGEIEFRGTAIDAGVFGGRTKLRVVGGAGGLGKPTKPRFYHAIPAKTPLRDLLDEGKERLSSTSDSEKTGTLLSLWTRPAGVVSEGLEQLVDELGATWRMLPDGTVWIGVEAWPEAKVKDAVVLIDAAHEGRIEIESETPNLLPGTTFGGRRVSRVDIHLSPELTRTAAWFEGEDADAGGGDVVRAALEGLVRQATRHIDLFATYGAKVVSQNGDSTLELRPDVATLPGMSKVPLRAGPMTLKVKPGAEVNFVFLNGSPAKPCVTHVDPKSILQASLEPSMMVSVNALQVVTQNGRPVARVGDMVQVISTPPGTPAIGQIMTGNNFHRG